MVQSAERMAQSVKASQLNIMGDARAEIAILFTSATLKSVTLWYCYI